MNDKHVSPEVECCSQSRILFRQRNVLDMLRKYLEMSDDLLSDMHHEHVLNDDDVFKLMRLSWPENRNELMQILIRTQWTEKSFKSFCDILRQTSDLNRILADKLIDANSELSDNHAASERPATAPGGVSWNSMQWNDDVYTSGKPPLTTSLDILLDALSTRDRCTVQAMIRDRDERIALLMKQKEQLNNDLRGKEHALKDARIKNSLTETQVSNWLASLTLPTDADAQGDNSDDRTFEAGLGEVATIISRQSEDISQLSADNSQLRSQLSRVERQASEDRAMLNDRLEEVAADADAVRRQNEQLNKQLKTAQNELDRLRLKLVLIDERQSSGDSEDDQELAKRSGTKMKSKKTVSKNCHAGESSDLAAQAAMKPCLRRRLSVDVTASGRRDSDTTAPRRRRRGSIADDGKKSDKTAATASATGGRIATRRASISTAPPTSGLTARSRSQSFKSNER